MWLLVTYISYAMVFLMIWQLNLLSNVIDVPLSNLIVAHLPTLLRFSPNWLNMSGNLTHSFLLLGMILHI